jgi:deoxyribodipyrimidine photo-lyase
MVHQWENILSDMESSKTGISHTLWVPRSLDQADTGREWLDAIVRKMQSTGYLHNHERMWIAAYLVHFGKMHWRALADWTHYYFLDGDLAANHLSWQWVASTFSGKPYYFTSENIERYAGVKALELKGSYEEVWARIIDPTRIAPFEGKPILADLPPSDLKQYPRVWQLKGENILVLTPWSLDQGLVDDTRIKYPGIQIYLVLDEWFFARFPMSPARISWFTEYARILGAEIVRGDLGQLLSGFSGATLTLEECYQPSYRDAIMSARTRLGVKVLAFPHVHPQFGLKYFSRFFWYFASLPNSPELRS